MTYITPLLVKERDMAFANKITVKIQEFYEKKHSYDTLRHEAIEKMPKPSFRTVILTGQMKGKYARNFASRMRDSQYRTAIAYTRHHNVLLNELIGDLATDNPEKLYFLFTPQPVRISRYFKGVPNIAVATYNDTFINYAKRFWLNQRRWFENRDRIEDRQFAEAMVGLS